MADNDSGSKKSGLTRGKAITIGVLALVLVVVLYLQYGSTGAESTNMPSAYKPRRPVVEAPTDLPSPAATEKKGQQVTSGPRVAVAAVVDESRWKSPNLTEVVDYDPFALPLAFPQPQTVEANGANAKNLIAEAAEDDKQKLAELVAQQQMEWQELKQRGVHVIVRQHDEYVAVIGDQTVHVGEEILGYTVTRIDSQGVHVERKPAQ